MSAWVAPVRVWKVGETTPAGMPVNRIAARSWRDEPEALNAARFGNAPG